MKIDTYERIVICSALEMAIRRYEEVINNCDDWHIQDLEDMLERYKELLRKLDV